MFIEGIGISNFRSFGRETQYMGPFEKINLFVGQNNSGKSNILSFLTRHYSKLVEACQGRSSSYTFDAIDKHIAAQDEGLRIAFGMRIGGKMYEEILRRTEQTFNPTYKQDLVNAIKVILESPQLAIGGSQIAWFEYISGSQNPNIALDPKLAQQLRTSSVLNNVLWNN